MGSSNSSQALQGKTVVVVGCSFGGKTVAYPLRGKCKLVVVDPREAMHLTIASPRALVESDFVNKTFIPLQDVFGESLSQKMKSGKSGDDFVNRTLIPLKDVFGDSFKQGTVIAVNPAQNRITLSSGEEIAFDYLVLATGSSGPFPGKLGDDVTMAQAVEKYHDAYEKVKAAKRIVIVGGGAVGIEIAGEIATDYPDKEVTIVHSRDTLVEPATSDGFRTAVRRHLEELKVNLLLGERVTNLDSLPRDLSGATVTTDQGKSLEADAVFVCIGISINNQAFATGLANCMDDRGYLKVNQFLQVEGYQNIFAVGDCCNGDFQKMALRAGKQGEAALANIQLHADGKNLKPYKPPNVMFAVSIGRHRGQLQLGSHVIGSWLVKRVKSKDLMTGRMWGEWGLKPPAKGK